MHGKEQKIENILFDLGNVMVYLDYERVLRELAAYMPEADSAALAQRIKGMIREQVAFESGQMSGEEFFEVFAAKCGIKLSYRHFKIIWANLFSPVYPMFRLAGYLSGHFRVYYFSSTNELHVPAVYDLFPEMKVQSGAALSHELGVMKPEREFFTRAFARLKIDPHRSVFFDDVPVNVEAAALCGLEAYLHKSPAETISILVELLSHRNGFEIPARQVRFILEGK